MHEWQHINTVPTDRTTVLVGYNLDLEDIAEGSWLGSAVASASYYKDKFGFNRSSSSLPLDGYATHWMPMPVQTPPRRQR